MSDAIASDALIVELGSRAIRYGLSSEPAPRSLPACIAFRRRAPPPPPPDVPAPLAGAPSAQVEEAIDALRTRTKKKWSASTADVTCGVTRSVPGAHATDVDCWHYTDVSHGPRHVIGDAALHIGPGEPYDVRYPITAGQLSPGAAGSTRQAIDALVAIVQHVCHQLMALGADALSSMPLFLCIPDQMTNREIADLVDALFRHVRVFAIMVHRQSVLSCLGAGLPSACVVTLDWDFTSAVCVHDGIAVRRSGQYARTGRAQLLHLLLQALLQAHARSGQHRTEFPFHEGSLGVAEHTAALESLLLGGQCELAPPDLGPVNPVLKEATLLLNAARSTRAAPAYDRFDLAFGVVRFVPGESLYSAALFGATAGARAAHGDQYGLQSPHDHLDKAYLHNPASVAPGSRAKDVHKRAVAAANSDDREADSDGDPAQQASAAGGRDARQDGGRSVCTSAASSLDDLLMSSLDAMDDQDLQSLLCSQVLLIGPTAALPGFHQRLIYESVHEIQMVAGYPTTQSCDLAWSGAAALLQASSGEGCRPCWVYRGEWGHEWAAGPDPIGSAPGAAITNRAVHILRARVPFHWD